MKYIKNIINSFKKDGFNVLLPNVQCDNLSICFVDINGKRDTYCMLDESTILYYIIEGNGIFEINDEKVKVSKNDLIEIPPQNRYSYEGDFRMLEIQSQAFNENELHEFARL